MLMKPRRWLAYTIEVNDLLPMYEQVVDRFEASDVPLDGAFGSNTTTGVELPGVLLAVGSAVEPARLAEVLGLLTGWQLFVVMRDGREHEKEIIIGALNLDAEPVTAIAGELLATIMQPDATAADLRRAVDSASEVHVLVGREESAVESWDAGSAIGEDADAA
jgi:hypothetical protein